LVLLQFNSNANRFSSILPALAFSLDMFEKTAHSYGVNEVLLASAWGAVVFSFLAAQPLVIVGVTGELSSLIPAQKRK
jgi:boron transporter